MTRLKGALGALTICVFAAGGVAYAQAPQQPLTPPPNEANAPQACPPGYQGQYQGQYQAPQQPYQQPYQQPAPPPTTEMEPSYESGMSTPQTWLQKVGVAFTIGGGVEDFVGRTMRHTTGTGGAWNVRATIGTHSFLAGEIAYIGSAQSINALGLSRNSDLIGNGVQGDLRLNLTGNSPVQPFIFGGGAWRHYSLTNTDFNVSDVSDNTNVFELPAGAGIAFYPSDGFMVDVRGEYRWEWGEDLLERGNPSLDRWGVSGNLGFTF